MGTGPNKLDEWSASQLDKLSAIVDELDKRMPNLTNDERAAKIGINQYGLSRARNGKREVTRPVVEAICAFYDKSKSVEELLGAGIPRRRDTPEPFAAVRDGFRKPVDLEIERALVEALEIAKREEWWLEDLDLLARAYIRNRPIDDAPRTTHGWLDRLELLARGFRDAMAAPARRRQPRRDGDA